MEKAAQEGRLAEYNISRYSDLMRGAVYLECRPIMAVFVFSVGRSVISTKGSGQVLKDKTLLIRKNTSRTEGPTNGRTGGRMVQAQISQGIMSRSLSDQ